MKFAAISDTHDRLSAVRELVEILREEKLDFIVHAGGVISPFALKEFSSLDVPFYIAFGNNDGERKILSEIAMQMNWKIGDIVEFPGGIVYHGTDEEILKILRKTGEMVVTGHTHEARIERDGRSVLLNPGEVCGYLTGKRTFAIVENGEISIVEF